MKLHTLFSTLLSEQDRVSPEAFIFGDHSGLYNARNLIEASESNDRIAVVYIRALLSQLFEQLCAQYKFELSEFRRSEHFKALGDDPFAQAVEKGIRELMLAFYRYLPTHTVAWRFMSKTYTCEEWVTGIETKDETVIRTIVDMVRISRDVLKYRTMPEEK